MITDDGIIILPERCALCGMLIKKSEIVADEVRGTIIMGDFLGSKIGLYHRSCQSSKEKGK
jgi:hypothetical protein